MRANDVHRANVHNDMLAERYKPSVNEPETITKAQPLCLVRRASDANEPRARGLPVPAAPHIERS